MPTLYIRNVPQALYEALRERARANHRSIAAEFLALLKENIPTPKELRALQRIFQKVIQMRAKKTTSNRSFLFTEEIPR